jgi:hypothetical protein
MNPAAPLANDIITLYNSYSYKSGAIIKTRWDRTILTGVQWKADANRNVTGNGVSNMDNTVSITIPASVKAEGDRTYIAPEKYVYLPQDDMSHWTLNYKQGDVIVHGPCTQEITDLYTITQLKKDFEACDIKAVSDSTNFEVPELRQWKVRGI